VAALVPVLQALGERHAEYGVMPNQFPVVGEALMWTLEQGLGEAWTPILKSAWSEAWKQLVAVMRPALIAASERAALQRGPSAAPQGLSDAGARVSEAAMLNGNGKVWSRPGSFAHLEQAEQAQQAQQACSLASPVCEMPGSDLPVPQGLQGSTPPNGTFKCPFAGCSVCVFLLCVWGFGLSLSLSLPLSLSLSPPFSLSLSFLSLPDADSA